MKNKLIIGTVLTGMLLGASPVEAMGNAKVEFTSRDNIQVGETFTVSMSVTDINNTYDGVVSMGGNLSFDSTMVEYVSAKEVDAPYEFQINEDYGYKLAGLDFTLDNGIRENVTVYEFTFKALKEGNTTITLTNAKLTDSQDYINTVVLGEEITISEKEEEVVVKETVVEKKEDKVNKVNKVESNKVVEKQEVVVEETQEETLKNQESVEKIQEAVTKLVSSLKRLFK